MMNILMEDILVRDLIGVNIDTNVNRMHINMMVVIILFCDWLEALSSDIQTKTTYIANHAFYMYAFPTKTSSRLKHYVLRTNHRIPRQQLCMYIFKF